MTRSQFNSRFVGYGEVRPDDHHQTKELWLDVGGALRPGAIDHHQLAAYTGSTTALVHEHPGFIPAPKDGHDPLTIVLHRMPDLDCVAATWLALHWRKRGRFPEACRALIHYVNRVDGGYMGMLQSHPFSLYSAYQLLVHRLSQRVWRRPEDQWDRCVRQGLEVVDFVIAEMEEKKVSLLDVDAFAAPGLFGPQDRSVVLEDLGRYQAKLTDPACHAREHTLFLPQRVGGRGTASVLTVREVQNGDDPERCLFFKDWARSDRQRSPDHGGFIGLSVFSGKGANSPRRCILSVKPDGGHTLEGLGTLLDRAESQARIRLHGVDDRKVDPVTGQSRQNRPGYDNADPWYDGRGHGHTIVDSPRDGTLLTADEIEAIFLQFGEEATGNDSARKPVLPDPIATCSSHSPDAGLLHNASMSVESWRQKRKSPQTDHPLLFISYPRANLDEVKKRIYEPLATILPRERIFFDLHTLNGGVGWMTALADGVKNCRLFVPVYSQPYFNSDFCQWELQLALVRDPIGGRGLILPLVLEPVELPAYCGLIQSYSLNGNGLPNTVKNRIIDLIS